MYKTILKIIALGAALAAQICAGEVLRLERDLVLRQPRSGYALRDGQVIKAGSLIEVNSDQPESKRLRISLRSGRIVRDRYQSIKVLEAAPGSKTTSEARGWLPIATLKRRLALKADAQPTVAPAEIQRLNKSIAQANKQTQVSGTDASVCPDGQCGSKDGVGHEENSTLACQKVLEGSFPANVSYSDSKSFEASMEWILKASLQPNSCSASCKVPDYFMSNILSLAKNNLNAACKQRATCAQRCTTTRLTQLSCSRQSGVFERSCMETCSPYQGISDSERREHVFSKFYDIHADMIRHNPTLAKELTGKELPANNPNAVASVLVCLNQKRENHDFEPMDANCNSSAIGIGQILDATFYETLGLNSRGIATCLDIPVKDLAQKCGSFVPKTYHASVYRNYTHLTPRQIYERRSLDVDLQVRSNYAVFVNKMIYSGHNLSRALRGYYGQSDHAATNRIMACAGLQNYRQARTPAKPARKS